MNEAMRAASLILLHARLKAIPHTAPLIRRQVQTVINEISQIGSNSRMAQVMLFPLFTAGCETVDLNLREQILAKLRPAKGVIFNNRADLVATLNHIWDIRDLEPGLKWPGWAQKGEHKEGSTFYPCPHSPFAPFIYTLEPSSGKMITNGSISSQT